MSNFLTRDAILELKDITVKELTIPDKIPVWGGQTIYIRQLSRGKQDAYLRRQFGTMSMKQDLTKRGRQVTSQQMEAPDLYGHDAWLCVHAVCSPDGMLMFTEKDIDALNQKSGEAIGWIAQQILKFSDMQQDVDAITQTENSIKN